MNELIKIDQSEISGEEVQTVNARDLHEFLEVQTRFNDWIVSRIRQFGFEAESDFITLTENLVSGGKQTNYHISIDMAKELSMVERNAKGKEARTYFINCEKVAKKIATPQLPDFTNPAVAARAWADEVEQKQALELKIATDRPKIIFADAVDASQTSILVGDLAKLLRQNGVVIGQKRLFDWLRNNGWLMKTGESRNMPTQKSMERGFFKVKERTINNPDGSIRLTKTTKVTGKGQQYFINLFLTQDAA